MCSGKSIVLVAIATVSTVTLTTRDYEHMQSVVRNGERERLIEEEQTELTCDRRLAYARVSG